MRYLSILLLLFCEWVAAGSIITVTSSNAVPIISSETWVIPTITGQPSSVSVITNGNASFSVTGTGSLLSYYWKTNGTLVLDGGRISGSHTATITYTGCLITDDSTALTCLVSNACSTVLSSSATLTVTNGASGASLTTSLISFWRMDDAANATRADAFGGNDLTDIAADVAQSSGILTNSASFDGGNKTLSHPDNAALSVTAQDFSLQCWVKLGSIADNQAVCGKWGAVGNYVIYVTGDRFVFFRQDASGGGNHSVTANTFGALSTGVWYHVVGVQDFSNSQLLIYVNNVSDTSSSSDAGLDGTSAFTVGQFDGGGAILTGDVDLVGFWKRVLTAGDVSLLYNSGAARDPVTNP